MLQTIRQQLRVMSTDIGAGILISFGSGIFGFALINILFAVVKENEGEYIMLAALFAAIISALYIGIQNFVSISIYFNLEVSMGCTRKRFFLSYFIASFLGSCALLLSVAVIALAERAVYQLIYPGFQNAVDFTDYLLPYGLPVAFALPVLGSFCGTLLMRFGKWVGVPLWFLWMFGCIGIPRCFTAARETPNSLFGMIGNGILQFFRLLPGNGWFALGMLAALILLGAAWGILRRQQVVR